MIIHADVSIPYSGQAFEVVRVDWCGHYAWLYRCVYHGICVVDREEFTHTECPRCLFCRWEVERQAKHEAQKAANYRAAGERRKKK